MKIIIIGAGQLGSSLAINLVREGNDITLIDTRADLLEKIEDKIDLKTIKGNGAHPSLLKLAGAEDAHMLIAVSHSDEINMVACQVAYTVFNVPKKIARIRETEYIAHKSLFSHDSMPIDVLITPEMLVSNYIQELISHPGAHKIFMFENKKTCMVNLKLNSNNEQLFLIEDIQKKIQEYNSHILLLGSNKKMFKYGSDKTYDDDEIDEIFFTCNHKDINIIIDIITNVNVQNKRVMVAGGGKIGKHLCENISSSFQVKLIEENESNANYLSENLEDVTVICGDSSNEDILLEENIEHMDIFCSLTDDDEANVLSSMLAKRLGAKSVISIINKSSYSDLVEKDSIDIFISPEELTMGNILTHVRQGGVVSVHTLNQVSEEIIEVSINEASEKSKIIGKQVNQIDIPKDIVICCILRNEKFIFDIEKTIIENDDHLILYIANKKSVSEVENLFG